MLARELHARGLLDDEQAIVAALTAAGWPWEEAVDLLARHTAKGQPGPWRRWTAAEVAEIDAALDALGDRLPGAAVTRSLATRLGRSHRSITSAFERRIEARAR